MEEGESGGEPVGYLFGCEINDGRDPVDDQDSYCIRWPAGSSKYIVLVGLVALKSNGNGRDGVLEINRGFCGLADLDLRSS